MDGMLSDDLTTADKIGVLLHQFASFRRGNDGLREGLALANEIATQRRGARERDDSAGMVAGLISGEDPKELISRYRWAAPEIMRGMLTDYLANKRTQEAEDRIRARRQEEIAEERARRQEELAEARTLERDKVAQVAEALDYYNTAGQDQQRIIPGMLARPEETAGSEIALGPQPPSPGMIDFTQLEGGDIQWGPKISGRDYTKIPFSELRAAGIGAEGALGAQEIIGKRRSQERLESSAESVIAARAARVSYDQAMVDIRRMQAEINELLANNEIRTAALVQRALENYSQILVRRGILKEGEGPIPASAGNALVGDAGATRRNNDDNAAAGASADQRAAQAELDEIYERFGKGNVSGGEERVLKERVPELKRRGAKLRPSWGWGQ